MDYNYSENYLKENYMLDSEDLLSTIKAYVEEDEVRKNIIVKKANCCIYDANSAIFADKKYLYTNYVPRDFSFKRNEVYNAEFLLAGLRINEDSEFCYFLYFLYLRQIVLEDCIRYHENYKFWLSVMDVVKEYIKNKYKIGYQGTIGKYNGIPVNVGADKCLFYFDNNVEVYEKIRISCELTNMFWNSIFSSHGLYAFNDNRASRYGEDYYEYIIRDGTPCVFNENSSYSLEYIPVSTKIASKKYSEDDINKGEIVHLDNNIENFNEDNIVLFKTYEDYIRYKDGGVEYKIIEKNIYITSSDDISKDQFKKLYYKYSMNMLCKIINKSISEIRLLIKKYELPTKTELKHFTEEEYLMKY